MKEKWTTIIGIVGNVRHRGLDYDALPEYYIPIAQSPNAQAVLVVRSQQDPQAAYCIRSQCAARDRSGPADRSRLYP